MKINYPKSWFERRLPLESEDEIGAGSPYLPQVKTNANVVPFDTRLAFGTFVALWRRNKGWDVATLADKAGIDPEEILEIEQDTNSQPELDAVYKLARIFKLPDKPLLELAGLIETRTPRLREQAVRFAAHSGSVEALNQREREAFEAFASAIADLRNG